MNTSDAQLIDFFQEMLEEMDQESAFLDVETRLEHEPAIQNLAEMLETVEILQAAAKPVPDLAEGLERVRVRVMASVTDSDFAAESSPVSIHLPQLSWWQRLRAALQMPAVPRWATVAVAAVVVLALSMTTTISASAQALPGQPLYPVKRVTEQAKIFLTLDNTKKLQLQQQFKEERLDEISELQRRNIQAKVSYDGVLKGRKQGGWLIGDWLVFMEGGDQLLSQLPVGTMLHVTGWTTGIDHGNAIDNAQWSVIHVPETTPTPTPSVTPPSAQPGDLLLSAPTDTPAPVVPRHSPTPEPPRRHSEVKVPATATPKPKPTYTSTPTPTPTLTSTPTTTPTPLPTPIPTFQATGRLTGVTPTSIVIGGIIYQLGPDLSTSGLQIGSQIEVVYRILSDESRIALQIKVLAPAPTPSVRQVRGYIDDVDSGSITVAGQRFLFTGSTQFPAQPLAKGQYVRVTGHTSADGVSLFADQIELIFMGSTAFAGEITAVQGNIIIVNGTSVDTGQAQIKGRIQVGAWAEIAGKIKPDGTVLAESVVITPPTATPQPPTATPTTLPTETPTPLPPPTATPEHITSPTPEPPTATVAPPTATAISPSPTPEPEPPTATAIPPTPAPTATPTSVPAATPIPGSPPTVIIPTPQPTATPGLNFPSPTPITPY